MGIKLCLRLLERTKKGRFYLVYPLFFEILKLYSTSEPAGTSSNLDKYNIRYVHLGSSDATCDFWLFGYLGGVSAALVGPLFILT